jgi:hypothetical protein
MHKHQNFQINPNIRVSNTLYEHNNNTITEQLNQRMKLFSKAKQNYITNINKKKERKKE